MFVRLTSCHQVKLFGEWVVYQTAGEVGCQLCDPRFTSPLHHGGYLHCCYSCIDLYNFTYRMSSLHLQGLSQNADIVTVKPV